MSMSVLEYLLQGGPIGISVLLFWLLYQERKERKEAQNKLLEVSNALIEHATKTEVAIVGFTDLLKSTKDAVEKLMDKIDNM